MVSRTGITLTPRVGSAVPQHHADVKSRPHLSADLSSPIPQLPKEVPTTASRSYRGSAAGVIHGPCSTRSAFDTRAGESAKSAASPAGVWGRGHCAKQELVDHPRHICRALRHGEMVRRGSTASLASGSRCCICAACSTRVLNEIVSVPRTAGQVPAVAVEFRPERLVEIEEAVPRSLDVAANRVRDFRIGLVHARGTEARGRGIARQTPRIVHKAMTILGLLAFWRTKKLESVPATEEKEPAVLPGSSSPEIPASLGRTRERPPDKNVAPSR